MESFASRFNFGKPAATPAGDISKNTTAMGAIGSTMMSL
jgi:hypothetical protein